MKLVVDSYLSTHGYSVSINNKIYSVSYPPAIWDSFPKELRKQYSQMMGFVLTAHKSFNLKNNIVYLFPPPAGEALFYYGLFLSMPENVLDFENKYKTSDYVRFILNSHYHISFTGHPNPLPSILYSVNPKRALIPFTFGKDSLLTYALCKKMKLEPIPIFMLEPSNKIENKLKLRLIEEFKREFGTIIQTFSVPLATLKETNGLWWGWDIFLTQYTLHLLPYMYFYKAGYFFWSNEYECNEYIKDKEGFYLNDQFEQSGRWMQTLNSALRLFGCNAKLGSILEPLTELSIIALLHNNFPELGKYQASCLNDTTSKKSERWCGKCYECARVFISLLAIGVDPKRVHLNDNMLTQTKRDLYYVFKGSEDELHSKFPFLKNEKLYAFYLASRRGVQGELIKEFKHSYLGSFLKNNMQYRKQFFTPYPAVSIPEELNPVLYKYFDKELAKIKRKLPI